MITYNNVSLNYKGAGSIIKNLNFSIQEGEFFVLIGPSGSGKTTTLKMINRLVEPTDGNIYFKEKRLTNYNLRALRLEIGYVFQQIALFPNMTVKENISLIPEMKGFSQHETLFRAKLLLSKVGLNPDVYLDRFPSELSGGERQRIGIIRAIIGNPKVLLMDEPFSALDPISRVQLQNLIKELHSEFNMTTVFVTHDMEEAIKLADRICLMRSGEIVQIGTSDNLQNNPVNNFVTDFLKEVN